MAKKKGRHKKPVLAKGKSSKFDIALKILQTISLIIGTLAAIKTLLD